MIVLDPKNPQQRPMPQTTVPQGVIPQSAVPQGAAGGQQAVGPAVLFRQPQAAVVQPQAVPLNVGQPPNAGQPLNAGQPVADAQAQPPMPMSPLERLQVEHARLQELYGIIGQARAKLDAVRTALGKKSEAGSQYEQAVKGAGNANR